MPRWVTVMRAEELPPDQPVTVRVNERDLALARCGDGGDPHALDNRCPHRGGQLGDGTISGEDIICPLHGYDFDLHTGISRFAPMERVPVYPARIHEGEVQIDADAVPALPDNHDAGYLDRWARRHDEQEPYYEYLQGLRWGPPVSAMRTRKQLTPHWDDILLLPGQLAHPPRLQSEPLSLRTVLGQRAEQPLVLDVPFFVSHMSFGALSVSAKTALARVSAELGTAIGSGEGGMLDEEREHASKEIFEMASGYFGWSPQQVERADAVEIKIGQSAKAGSGGLLPADKVTARIAMVRGPAGRRGGALARTLHGHPLPRRAAHAHRGDPRAPRRRARGHQVAAGRVEEDLDAALEAGADFVTIDGRGGGTGAAPEVLKDHLTVPIQYALHRARTHLAARGIDDLDIVATGHFRIAADVTKAIAMGATAVALATASMVAIGCQQYLACHTGNCPVGIATQRADLEARFDIAESSEKGVRTFQAFREEIELLCRAVGVADIHELTTEHLATLDSELAAHTSIRHA